MIMEGIALNIKGTNKRDTLIILFLIAHHF